VQRPEFDVGKPYKFTFLEISKFEKINIIMRTYGDSENWYGICLKFIRINVFMLFY